MAAREQSKFTHHFATATDGARLSYYTTRPSPSDTNASPKPNVLVIHGAACYALTHAELALALSPYYTVHTASRRGRGRSDPYPDDVIGLYKAPPSTQQSEKEQDSNTSVYSSTFSAAVLATDVSDLTTLINATQAQHVICVSSGGLVALEHLRLLAAGNISPVPTYKSVIIFEPPFFATRTSDTPASEGFEATAVRDFEVALTAGDVAGAAVESIRAARIGPIWIFPRWFMKMACGMMFRSQEKKSKAEETALAAKKVDSDKQTKGKDEEPTGEKIAMKGDAEEGELAGKGVSSMSALVPLIRYDFAVVENMIGDPTRFNESHKAGVKVLCLRGSKSPSYLRDAIAKLATSISESRLVEIEGVGHEVMCGADMRGKPEKAVQAVRDFFGSQ